MTINPLELSVDCETCCEEDLRKVGADIYSRSSTLIVTVWAWALGTGPIQSERCPQGLPRPILDHLTNGGLYRAWNAAFEWAILTNHYHLDLQPHQAICTMQQALHSGLPAALGDAGPALGLAIVKDKSARQLMLRMSRPREVHPVRTYWHDDPVRIARLEAYCQQDVASERAIGQTITRLPDSERLVSLLDQKANDRGVQIDLDLVARLKRLSMAEIERLSRECAGITGGAVAAPGSNVGQTIGWLRASGLAIPNLSKESVALWLANKGQALNATQRRVLEIRQEIARSSIKKLDAMERCAGPDGKVRGQLAYYGAFRTGRFAGRLIQPQNFPRPIIEGVEAFIRQLKDGADDPDFIALVYGKPLDAVASALRGCLTPAAGKRFVVFDLSQIEARMVAWLAGQKDVLNVFARGEDVYVYTADALGLPAAMSFATRRKMGKVARLALGFQMGPAKLMDTARKDYGVVLSTLEAEAFVRAFRDANPKIVALWWAADRACRQALDMFTKQKGKAKDRPITLAINDKLSVTVSKSRTGRVLMTLKLPSGRRLYYRNAALEPEPLDPTRMAITYDGVDPRTKRWTRTRTYGGKIIENATQAAARDVIVEGALRVDSLKLGDLVLSAHDELVEEVDSAVAELMATDIEREIVRRPLWARDLPVAADGGVKDRYGK